MDELPYFTPTEVNLHNKDDDLWVSFLWHVYDLTEVVNTCGDQKLVEVIRRYAGKDISHWFNPETGNLHMYYDIFKDTRLPARPHRAPLLHVPPDDPRSDWPINPPLPWWLDKKHMIGHLTKKVRKVRMVNALASIQHLIETCDEEPIKAIIPRYHKFNRHAASYVWKYDRNVLDMDRTLTENGVPDDSHTFCKLGLPQDLFIPAILLYYSDDLTQK